MATIQLSTEAMIGIIVGSVVGGILLLLVFGVCVYFCCCRKKRRSEKPPKRIEETRQNGYTNRAFPATTNMGSLPANSNDELDSEKTVGYAYPIVGGRPVSYPYFGAVDPVRASGSTTSSAEAKKPKHPVQRQTSVGLPPNAYRLPGLADKSFSMSETNINVVGTVNPAYDETGDSESMSRHIYRTQSLMNVDHRETDGSTASSNRREFISRLSSFNEEANEVSSSKNRNSMEYKESDKQAQTKIRVAHELEAADHVYALPNKQKRKAPEQPGPPKGLPRIPLDSPLEVDEPPKSPERGANARRSLTSEMSYQTKGNLVTDQAFDFLEGYADESPKS